jgi:hypothetical protein
VLRKEGTLSRWSRLRLQSLAPTNPEMSPRWWVMARSPYVESIGKTFAPAVRTLID